MAESTEEKIYEAARRIFLLKGMDGARMQEIADEAGINKALLHYYFRSKDNLFKAVFKDIFTKFFERIRSSLFSDAPKNEKLTVFIDNYIDMIQANPYVPQFIVNEINRDPKVLKNLMFDSGVEPRTILELFGKPHEINPALKDDPRHLVVSILGMIVFPFAARPLLQMVYFNNNPHEYDHFLQERKEVLKKMILKMTEE